jgi:HEAT repeat protein
VQWKRFALWLCLLLPLAARAQDNAAWEGKTACEWTGQLKEKDVRARWYAAYSLGQLGPAAVEAAGPLRRILEQEEETQHEYVRATAAWALGRIGAHDEATIAGLTKTLKSSPLASVRRNAAEALGMLGEPAKTAAEVLEKALEDKDAIVRVRAAAALWKIEKHPKAVPALLEILRKGEAPAPYYAAMVLGQLGADPETVAPALVEAFHHTDADVRRAATRSLGQIGRAAGPALGKALKDPDEEVWRSAVEAMGWMGAEAVGPLVKVLEGDGPAAARRAAARALGRLGPEAKSAASTLTKAAADPNEEVRNAAAKALLRVRPER